VPSIETSIGTWTGILYLVWRKPDGENSFFTIARKFRLTMDENKKMELVVKSSRAWTTDGNKKQERS
jgi:hypothetical protein